MPRIVRLTDACSGHNCFPPRPNSTASTNVFANNLGIHRVGDTWLEHCCGPVCHGGAQTTGSPNVFVNNKAVARVGDQISCGSQNLMASPNVYANG